MKKIHYLSMLTTALLFTACGEKKQEADVGDQTGENPVAAAIVSEQPDNAKPISDIREKSKIGDEVTFHGKIMGRIDPFVSGRAIFLMGDPEMITSCDLIPGDECKTPWDVCCDDPDIIKQSIITVQILDSDGRPLKSDVKGVAGIKELTELVISGKVAKGSNKDNMLVDASAIYVKK